MIEKRIRAQAVAAGGPFFRIFPFRRKKVGMVTTGNKVFHSRIQDAFPPVILEKVKAFGAEVIGHGISKDDHARLTGYVSPVLSGAMFLVGCRGEKGIPIPGMPGCAKYSKRTALDPVPPHALPGDALEQAVLNRLGEGGLCPNRKEHSFPLCGFGMEEGIPMADCYQALASPDPNARNAVMTVVEGAHIGDKRLLSGGQRQRMALARAMVVEPSMLLFDEPLSNLDAKLRVSMRTEIRRIQQTLGITAVYVTHDQAEAMAISDNIIVMNKGVVAQMGTPEEICHHPKSEFAADFIGEVHFLTGEITQTDGEACTLSIAEHPVRVPNPEGFPVGKACKVVLRPEAGILADTGALPCRVCCPASWARTRTTI